MKLGRFLLLGVLVSCFAACEPSPQPLGVNPVSVLQAATEAAPTLPPLLVITTTTGPTATSLPPSTPTPRTTDTPTPQNTERPVSDPTNTPTPVLAKKSTEELVSCSERIPSQDDLLVWISKTYGVSRDFEPEDLVPLDNFFPFEITLGYPTQIRRILLEPLQRLIRDMQAAGLEPQIISGYRSYVEQAIAFQKWIDQFPDRAGLLSAPAGHSEHQLGTTVDFGSPNLEDHIEEDHLQFHTYFYKTPEGEWLREHAHRYGFTMSYTREAQEITGFYYEPWHFRYVGEEMATFLKENELTLTDYYLANRSEPCIPINQP